MCIKYSPISLSLVCIIQIITGTVLSNMMLLVRLVIATDTVVYWHLLGKFLFTFRIYIKKCHKEYEPVFASAFLCYRAQKVTGAIKLNGEKYVSVQLMLFSLFVLCLHYLVYACD